MPLDHRTKVYGTQQVKIYPVTLDVVGSTTTYGAGVLVPGAKEIQLTPEVDSKELRGDNTLLDADAVLTGLKGKIKFAKLSLDVLNILTGSALTDTGVTPTQKSVWSLKSADAGKFFKLDAQAVRSDPVGGDVHYILYKCKFAGFPMGLMEEDYQHMEFDFIAMPQLGTGLSWLDVAINETAVAPA